MGWECGRQLGGGGKFLRVEWIFRVGSGNRVKYWKDKWCDDFSLRELFLELF